MAQLEELSVFIRVVEAGSISRAAEQLGIAKSAVSRRLAELEKRLGVTLINRTTRQFHLSEAGQRCYNHALRVNDMVLELEASVAQEQLEIGGNIRLSVPTSLAVNVMGPILDEFLRKHPGVKLDMDVSDNYVDIVESGFDLAIRVGEMRDSLLKARPLAEVKIYLAASPAYLSQHGEPDSLEALATHRFLLYGGLESALRFIDKNGGTHEAHLNPHLVINNGDVLHQLAVLGQGIIFTPSFISEKAIRTGQLVRILPQYQAPPRYIYAAYPNTRFLPKRVRLIIDYLVEAFSPIGPRED